MNTANAVRERIIELCKEKNYTIHGLAIKSAMNQSTIRDFMNSKTNNIGIITIKMLCDGFEISLADFFNTDIFKNLEQEIS